jgi:hypothetical protein
MISQVHLGYESNSTMNPGKSTYEVRFFDLIFLAAEIAASLWVHIQFFETTLRKFIHFSLKEIYGIEEWWDKENLLYLDDKKNIESCMKRMRDREVVQLPHLVVDNLSLSFWIRLLGRRYHETIWLKIIRNFPVYPGRREEFHRKAREIRNLRNSIAHHGPILRRNLLRDLTYLNELTSLLNPTLAIEVEKRSRALELIQNAQLVGSGGGI